MTPQSAALDRWFGAFNAHDLDALAGVADADISLVPLENSETAPKGATYHGHSGIRSLVQPGFDRYPELPLEAARATERDASMIVPMRFVLDDGVAPAQERDATSVFALKDNRVRSIRAYATESAAVAAVYGPAHRVLTPREREIMALMAEGMTATEVAERLFISQFTVRTHVRNATGRLGARTVGHAIAIALRSHEFDG
jgi:DNA-binding CsgD family transcriptional regulator